jgi:hypothetical protein
LIATSQTSSCGAEVTLSGQMSISDSTNNRSAGSGCVPRPSITIAPFS